MNNPQELLDEFIRNESDRSEAGDHQRYIKFGLRFNPFPRSGTANINSSDVINEKLIPVDSKVLREVIDFIHDSLQSNGADSTDKFIAATITGSYGSGKTQLLLFVKYLLARLAIENGDRVRPYVLYVDNPGVKLPEFIGSIISRVGEEDFKKYVWTRVIGIISDTPDLKGKLTRHLSASEPLFPDDTSVNPYAPDNTMSYRTFMDAYLRQVVSHRQRQEFINSYREVLMEALTRDVGDNTLATYFYEMIAEGFGVNKTWEALSAGTLKPLDGKQVEIIKYIARLIRDQGFTDFYILVDEFEDITKGRLTKAQSDNYIYNLRTLLDEHRQWCLIFAMTGEAYVKLKSLSPPLADRISGRRIILQDLDLEQGMALVRNYLSIALVKETDKAELFDHSAISQLIGHVDGNTRYFLRHCFHLLEKAVGLNAPVIDADFVNAQITLEGK